MTRAGYDTSVPALLLMIGEHAWDYGAVATVRTLGRVGIPVYVALADTDHPVTASKYLTGVIPWRTTGGESEDTLVAGIRDACRTIGRKAVAIAGDDESAVLLARRRTDLADVLLLPDIAPDLPDRLAAKGALAELCAATDTPTPRTIAPRTQDEVAQFAATAAFPLVVKNPEPFSRLVARSVPATTKVDDHAALAALLADWTPGTPLVIQEFLPQATSQDWYVAATLTDNHRPAAAFSGRKLRAFPDATGVGTLSESRYNAGLIETAMQFCAKVGYSGVCDMDWRLDERDGVFKLLDFNPRRGAQFRTFRSSADVDVVRALHLVLTGRPVPEGREVDGIRHVVGILDQKAFLAQRSTPTATGHPPLQRRGSERSWWASDDPGPWWTFARQLGPVRRLTGGATASDPPPSVDPGGWRSLVVADPPPRPLEKAGPPRPIDRWVATLPGTAADEAVIVGVAQNTSAVDQLAHEAAARSWAARNGVPVPRDLAAGEGWLISERVQVLPSQGADYVHAAMAAATRIGEASDPPPVAVSEWKGRSRDLPQRLARAVIGRLPLAEFRRARAATAELPTDTWVHGDFSNANVLWSPAGVRIIDWEFVGRGPLGTDPIRLWSTLNRREDRDLLIDTLVAQIPADRRANLGVLIHWLALRQLAENLAAPRKHQNPGNIALAHATLREARQWRQRLVDR
jgi:D-aspartate ligase